MERLTGKNKKDGYHVRCNACPRNIKEGCGHDDCIYVLTKRLASYEDTGLTPQQIEKLRSERNAMAALADSYKAEIRQWIPVSERLPSKEDADVMDGYIIAVQKGRKPNIIRWVEVASYPHYFSHWMPVSFPPKEDIQ